MATGGNMLRLLAKYPKTSITSVGLTGTGGYAYFVESQAQSREYQHLKDPSVEANTLPRYYDWDSINKYWSERPISTAKRCVQITWELVPVISNYVKDVYILQQDKKDATTLHDHDDMMIQHASQLREALTNLGPAFVKAGQQLSIRPDLVPASVIGELQRLCDEVRPISDEIAFKLLQKELNIQDLATIFDSLELVASASLGQVYKAKLKKSGDDVAVKIQRPGMLQSFSLDLYLLKKLGVLLDTLLVTFTQQAPYHNDLFCTFARGSYAELDYENEAKNQIKFKTELYKRNCEVLIPSVYETYTTKHILTTQWIEGKRLSDSSKETIERLIPVGVELFLTQLLDLGCFHADPHPGNLLVTTDNKTGKSQLCLLDFGLCAEVDEKNRLAITRAIVHLLIKDYDTLISQDAKELGFLPSDFNTEEVKPILTKILTTGLLGSANLQHRKRKLMDIADELNEIFFRYPFNVPPFFALITRGLGILEGIALSGNPDFDIFRATVPYAKRRAVGMFGPQVLSKLRNFKTSKYNTT